ncbi:MAG TPA: TlpA disulfide reductase family protein [Phycisphaerae bacterium]|nr:TlpA disulfide reductase family protein [Phycisphaerae bacterium]
MLTRLVALAAITLAITTAASAADLPRYKLQPGEVLTFHNTGIRHDQKGEESGSDGQLRIVVAGQNGEAWNIIAFSSSNYWRGKRPEATTQPAAPQNENMQKAVLHADGRIDPSPDISINLGGYFLPLPQKEADLAGYTADAPFNATLTITPSQRPDKQWLLDVKEDSLENVIYIVTQHQTATIDPDRGLPVRIENSFSQDYGIHQKGTGVNELVSVENKDPAWAAQLWKDAQTLDAANAAYGKAEEALTGDEAAMKSQLEKARDAFAAVKANIQSPEIQAQFQSRMEMLPRYEKYTIQETLDQAKVLNQPAPDWTLDQLGANTKVSLKDLRGKVVVLDWWYRGCGWCMRAMPQIKQVAADYKDRGVVIFGMNIDRDQSDALFVMDKMALNYGTLKASDELAKQYGVHGYPTMIIIDQAGIVRKLDVGYTPDLRKHLSATLDSLLKPPG